MLQFTRIHVGVIATLIWLFTAALVEADTVVLFSSEDSTISENSPDSAAGGDTTIISGADGPDQGALRNRALLKFNFSASIPSNAVVTSANLTLTLVKTPRADNLWFSLHKVLQDWTQTAVTWTNRLSPPAPWNVPGCAAPLDYSTLVTQSNLILAASVPASFTFVSNSSMIADVQDWVSNPANNFGWILICEAEAVERTKRFFASSEYKIFSIPTNQPSLEVQFTLPPPPLTLTLLPPTNGLFQFRFNAESNHDYTVEYCVDSIGTNWNVLTNFSAAPSPPNVLVSDPLLSDNSRFYRVRTP